MEGCSIITKNLSQVIAEEPGEKVLIIDLNFRLASKESGDNQPKGLSDFFLEDYQLDSVIKKTDINNLYLLPSGSLECNPLLIIESDKYFEMMQTLKKEYSFIIIDSPPMQQYPEATLLASNVDGVLLVVQAERTRREIVTDAVKKLETVNAKILGIVLNRKKHYIPKSIYTRL
jgi:capsular exopolysaccharide synthesis family protein